MRTRFPARDDPAAPRDGKRPTPSLALLPYLQAQRCYDTGAKQVARDG